MVNRVLDPLKVQKTNSSTNTDDDDDTISMMSFDDPVSFNDAVEEDMNVDNILQQQSFLGPVLPHYVPPHTNSCSWSGTSRYRQKQFSSV